MLLVLEGSMQKINEYLCKISLYKISLNPYPSGWKWVAIAGIFFCPLLSSGGDPQVYRYLALQLYN